MEERTMTTEDRATTSTSPSPYNPNMGLKAGRVTELRIFFHVKPGHAEQLKEACRNFAGGGARTSIENALRVGISRSEHHAVRQRHTAPVRHHLRHGLGPVHRR